MNENRIDLYSDTQTRPSDAMRQAMAGAAAVAEGLADHGMRIGAMGETRLRAVTHFDVIRDQVEDAGEAVHKVVSV